MKFTFTCLQHDEDIIKVLESDTRPQDVKCDECGMTMQRLIEKANNIVIKGSRESNEFYTPPTNAELGLGSDLDQEADAVKKATEYLSAEDQDLKKDYDAAKKAELDKLNDRVKRINQKYGDFANKFHKVLKDKIEAKKAQRGLK